MSSKPLAVAITGGIGAGKSEALRAFARHGAAVISSDEIVHELLRSDAKVKEAIRTRLGDGVFAPDGSVDRDKVAQVVFGSPDDLRWLEQLLHPRVVASYLKWRDRLADLQDPPPLSVTEVPLLYEVGGEKQFDRVVVITAPADVRAARRAGIQSREPRLLPDEEKAKRADFAYVNDGSLEDLDRFVADVFGKLTRG
jgi:dephospho-CoA kinase